MQQLSIYQAIQAAQQHHRAGRLADAEGVYRQILAQVPQHPDALFGLGAVFFAQGRISDSIATYGKLIQLKPDFADAYFNLAYVFQSQMRLDEAIAAYSRAIQFNPAHAPACNNLGNALKAAGKFAEAIAAYNRAIQIQGDYLDAYVNLGALLQTMKRNAEAVAVSTKAVQLRPRSAMAHFNLGCALANHARNDQALASFTQAIQLQPTFADAHYGMANALYAMKKHAEAVQVYVRAVELKPDHAEAYNNLGNCLRELGRADESIMAFRKSVELQPNNAVTHFNMAGAFWAKKAYEQVVASYKRAIELQADFPDAWYNLGIAYYEQGRLDEAADAYEHAFRLRPNFTLAWLNMGNVRKDQGLLDEALAYYDRALALEPGRADIHSNRAYVVHFHPGFDRARIFAENREWNRRHAEPLKKFIQPHPNPRDPDRRLKIGYVSPDFGIHPIGRFIMPLIRCHDHAQFEIHCYADVTSPDSLTDELRKSSDTWRSVVGMTDEQVAQLVRDDGIDVLVDLAMHMTKNRLLAFARKPAPVQVTYLAYCSTTGMDAIDYRFTDPYLDPPGVNDAFYSERSIYLQSYWCYDVAASIEVGALPAATAGYVTFGCLNNFCKASPAALAAWCEILKRVPGSRFVLHASPGSQRQRVLELLKRQGIDPQRVKFLGHQSLSSYFLAYKEIDVCLDPFPWPGGTTTCDALWLGVPVVSLAGETAVSRAGVSILSNVGLPELVTHSQEQYVQIAVDLAGDLARLADVRAGLRQRMKQSPLMDATRFARDVERAYRETWRRWCGAGQA